MLYSNKSKIELCSRSNFKKEWKRIFSIKLTSFHLTIHPFERPITLLNHLTNEKLLNRLTLCNIRHVILELNMFCYVFLSSETKQISWVTHALCMPRDKTNISVKSNYNRKFTCICFSLSYRSNGYSAQNWGRKGKDHDTHYQERADQESSAKCMMNCILYTSPVFTQILPPPHIYLIWLFVQLIVRLIDPTKYIHSTNLCNDD